MGHRRGHLIYNSEQRSVPMNTSKYPLKSPEKAFMYEKLVREVDDYDDIDELKADFKAWIKLTLKQKEMTEQLLKDSIQSELNEQD